MRVLFALGGLVSVAFFFRFENVEVVEAAVVELSSGVLLKVSFLALREMPCQSQRGHLVLGVNRACDVRVIIVSHLSSLFKY